jgi:DHA2 family multidrug resistance protein-like MFS transporter
VIISIGLAPVFGLTTELIVGSAPPERAGAASGISETGAEFGGALGISILGSIGVAVYRADVGGALESVLTPDQVSVAQDTLGGAAILSNTLPADVAATLMSAAREAFVHGIHVTAALAGISAVVPAGLAIATLRRLRPRPGRRRRATAAAPMPNRTLPRLQRPQSPRPDEAGTTSQCQIRSRNE